MLIKIVNSSNLIAVIKLIEIFKLEDHKIKRNLIINLIRKIVA